jgi:hypothetical protein
VFQDTGARVPANAAVLALLAMCGCSLSLPWSDTQPTDAGTSPADVACTPPPMCPAGGAACVVVSGEDEPWGITTDSTNVYWTTIPGLVKAAPLSGGPPVTLASNQGSLSAIVNDGTGVYWTGSEGLMKAPLDGGAPVVLYPVPGDPGASVRGRIAVGPGGVYVEFAGGTIVEFPSNGTPFTTVATGVGSDFAVDAANVYSTSFTENAVVTSTPLDGGAPATLATGQYLPDAIVAAGGRAYWIAWSGDVRSASAASPGSITTLASKEGAMFGLAVDSQYAYWSNDVGVIQAPLDGGPAATLVPGVVAQEIALAPGGVYWTTVQTNLCDANATGAGGIMMIPSSGP